jgi:hypothetical protein
MCRGGFRCARVLLPCYGVAVAAVTVAPASAVVPDAAVTAIGPAGSVVKVSPAGPVKVTV